MKLRTLLVEDESLSQFYLNSLLKQLPMVEVLAKAATEEEAILAIETLKPDLVFLDIELYAGSGFEVLRKTHQLEFSVVFTTALEQQAIKIIRLSGVPFLQKPIDADELAQAVTNVQKNKEAEQTALGCLLETLHHNNVPQHINIRYEEVAEYVRLDDVISIETKEAGTVVLLRQNSIKKSSLTIKDWENLLSGFKFFRTAATHLVNIKAVEQITGNVTAVLMKDGSAIPLSPKKSDAFITALNGVDG